MVGSRWTCPTDSGNISIDVRPFGPSFICIGAAKAGTTWLWENLDRHPEVWVPPIKELHWFDTRRPPRGVAASGLFKHRHGLRRYGPLLRRPSWHTAAWLLNFYSALDRGGDYCTLFDRTRAAALGDITPAYATLDADAVTDIHATVPDDCRIIFIMREPVDRLWSGLRMYCRQNNMAIGSLDTLRLDELSQFPEHALRSDYVRTLDHWSVFGDRFGVFFYEDLSENPAAFLSRTLQFLGVDSTWKSPLLNRVSNVGDATSAPPGPLLQTWRERYAPIAAAVRHRIGRVPQAWSY